MALEARGLDVTPGMIERLEAVGDQKSADVLRVILHDEVGHVAAGVRWFRAICAAGGERPDAAFRERLDRHFAGPLKRPFNGEARDRAGFPRAWYEGATRREEATGGAAFPRHVGVKIHVYESSIVENS